MEPYCCSGIIIDYVKISLEIVALLSAIFTLFVYFYHRFAPIILLDIQHDWISKDTGQVILKIRVENKSKVRVTKKCFLLQIVEHDAKISSLSEWVPKSGDKTKDGEEPLLINDSIKFMESTVYIYPGEFTTLDFLTTCPKEKLLHILLQFQSKLTVFKKLGCFAESWAITRIIINDK